MAEKEGRFNFGRSRLSESENIMQWEKIRASSGRIAVPQSKGLSLAAAVIRGSGCSAVTKTGSSFSPVEVRPLRNARAAENTRRDFN